MGLLIIQGKVQLCIFSLADLQSGKLKSDTNSLLPLYFTTESHFGFSGSSSILPHHLFLCIPPYTNTQNTWQYFQQQEWECTLYASYTSHHCEMAQSTDAEKEKEY